MGNQKTWPFRHVLRAGLPLAVIVCACAGRMEPRAAYPAPMGMIVVSVHLPLAGPLRHDRTQILLDGVPVPDGIPVPSIDPLQTVEIVVDASVACGLLSSPRATIRVHDMRTVLGTGPAVVDFYVLDSGEPTKQPLSRLSGKWTFRGAGFWSNEYSPSSVLPFPARCAPLGALRRAECRVVAALDSARQQRDVVQSICRNAKLTAIRDALPQAEAGDSNAAATVFLLEREAIACEGEGPAVIARASITEQAGCGVELPEVESPR